MGKKLSTDPKSRDDAGFNPFMEVQKIIEFADQSGRISRDTFSVYVKDGILEWCPGRLGKEWPGFIAVIDRVKFAEGLTTSAWRKLEEKVAIEICKQRKAW